MTRFLFHVCTTIFVCLYFPSFVNGILLYRYYVASNHYQYTKEKSYYSGDHQHCMLLLLTLKILYPFILRSSFNFVYALSIVGFSEFIPSCDVNYGPWFLGYITDPC